jgi:hypothetical protein
MLRKTFQNIFRRVKRRSKDVSKALNPSCGIAAYFTAKALTGDIWTGPVLPGEPFSRPIQDKNTGLQPYPDPETGKLYYGLFLSVHRGPALSIKPDVAIECFRKTVQTDHPENKRKAWREAALHLAVISQLFINVKK